MRGNHPAGRERYLATVKDRQTEMVRMATASSPELAVKKLELDLLDSAAMLTGQEREPSPWGEER